MGNRFDKNFKNLAIFRVCFVGVEFVNLLYQIVLAIG